MKSSENIKSAHFSDKSNSDVEKMEEQNFFTDEESRYSCDFCPWMLNDYNKKKDNGTILRHMKKEHPFQFHFNLKQSKMISSNEEKMEALNFLTDDENMDEKLVNDDNKVDNQISKFSPTAASAEDCNFIEDFENFEIQPQTLLSEDSSSSESKKKNSKIGSASLKTTSNNQKRYCNSCDQDFITRKISVEKFRQHLLKCVEVLHPGSRMASLQSKRDKKPKIKKKKVKHESKNHFEYDKKSIVSVNDLNQSDHENSVKNEDKSKIKRKKVKYENKIDSEYDKQSTVSENDSNPSNQKDPAKDDEPKIKRMKVEYENKNDSEY